MEKQRTSSRVVLFVLIVFLASLFATGNLLGQSGNCAGTWATANYALGENNLPHAPLLANNTLRQAVRVPIGGQDLADRVFQQGQSCTCGDPCSKYCGINRGASVDPATIAPLKFNGQISVTLSAHGSVTSDPVSFPLTPSMCIAITIHYGEVTHQAQLTGHVGSRTDSYLLAGGRSTDADFMGGWSLRAGSTSIPPMCLRQQRQPVWPFWAIPSPDGYGLPGGLQNRWPDIFSQQLLSSPQARKVVGHWGHACRHLGPWQVPGWPARAVGCALGHPFLRGERNWC